ncbi:Replication protein A 32 kDa subunit A [Apostasia shenzhenica]|uniref:Replication protein A 32 kDa subunit A n=1 Tax=Apostasia shenzhenica TaxID=1088818 RepID=A0A2I0AUL3_9ASPA|nr:Replication protein A 32 kDa subunit A [Apostasia shenzhenica]
MSLSQFDSGASLFSGGGFMASQAAQPTDSTLSKNRASHGVLPLTVKQIKDAYQSSEDKSTLFVDGIGIPNVCLLGIVMNKMEKATDVSFALDDGTGRVNVIRWVNETADRNEVAVIQNGVYVLVIGSLKSLHGKLQVTSFSIRLVVDYNEVPLHFIHCIQIHAEHTRKKIGSPFQLPGNSVNSNHILIGVRESRPAANHPSIPTSKGNAEDDIYKLVLDVFEEPESLTSDHGLHVDEVVKKLGIPLNKIKEAIDYHVDVGHIYSTIDDYHFKSACTS